MRGAAWACRGLGACAALIVAGYRLVPAELSAHISSIITGTNSACCSAYWSCERIMPQGTEGELAVIRAYLAATGPARCASWLRPAGITARSSPSAWPVELPPIILSDLFETHRNTAAPVGGTGTGQLGLAYLTAVRAATRA